MKTFTRNEKKARKNETVWKRKIEDSFRFICQFECESELTHSLIVRCEHTLKPKKESISKYKHTYLRWAYSSVNKYKKNPNTEKFFCKKFSFLLFSSCQQLYRVMLLFTYFFSLLTLHRIFHFLLLFFSLFFLIL